MKLCLRRWIYRVLVSGLLALGVPIFTEAQQSPFEASIRMDSSQRLHKVSPLLHGHFTEFMFEGIKGGMWAELLRNRSFEETAPRPSVAHYWEPYPDNRNDPLVQTGGRPDGINLSEQGYPTRFPNRAQVMVSTFPDPLGGGINRGDIPLRAGVMYRGSVWLRGANAQRQYGKTTSTFSPSDPALGKDIPALDAVAATNADGSEIYLAVVNTDVTRPGRTRIEVAGAGKIAPRAEIQTINGPSLEAPNTFEAPERISPRTSALENASNSFVYSFEKHSVTLLTLHGRNR